MVGTRVCTRVRASRVRSRRSDSRDGGTSLVVRNEIGASLRGDGRGGACVEEAFDSVVDHAEDEGLARAVGVAVALACGRVLRARGLGEDRLLRVAAARGVAANLGTGREDLVRWKTRGEGDERRSYKKDGGGKHFRGWIGRIVIFYKWIESLQRLEGELEERREWCAL